MPLKNLKSICQKKWQQMDNKKIYINKKALFYKEKGAINVKYQTTASN